MTELRAALSPFGFCFDEEKDLATYENLETAQMDAAELAVRKIDSKYFNGDPARSLWRNRAHVERCIAYVRKRLPIFRKRKS